MIGSIARKIETGQPHGGARTTSGKGKQPQVKPKTKEKNSPPPKSPTQEELQQKLDANEDALRQGGCSPGGPKGYYFKP